MVDEFSRMILLFDQQGKKSQRKLILIWEYLVESNSQAVGSNHVETRSLQFQELSREARDRTVEIRLRRGKDGVAEGDASRVNEPIEKTLLLVHRSMLRCNSKPHDLANA